MANEEKKDFNAMLLHGGDMPKIQLVTDPVSIKKYGGNRMYFAPPRDYDRIMRLVPAGRLLTIGAIRAYLVRELNETAGKKNMQGYADFMDPITAGIFVSIAAWASYQRALDKTPYWRTLKANGELNPKYPGGVESQLEKLEAEGHKVIARGRTNIRYYVLNYEKELLQL